jgi:choline ABC transporter choline binding protein
VTSNGPHNAKPLRTGDPQELGDYRIHGRLGRGGMGTVYLAEDPQGRRVALKLIHPDLSDDEAFRRRFAREVSAARSVARFSTAAVLDAQLEGETLYIISEYVAGPNLNEAIQAEGPMFSGTLEGLAMGVAAALTAIHGAGVIHRDLKPANVLLSSVGPKVIDFGIARALDEENAVTRSSQLMGTAAYLAPELIMGEDITPASDIFSWGCLVAFAGTGNAPFDAPTVPAVLHQISTAEPNLEGAKYTLAVPQYTFEAGLQSFSDIATFRDELDGQIYGIEPGNDGNRLILDMIEQDAFGLSGFELVESSEQGMLSQVERASRRQEWIVFLGWEPHPMNANFDMAYLDGGDDWFGPDFGGATVYTNTRAGYVEECPNVGRFLQNQTFTLAMENEIMSAILDRDEEPEDAARAWLKANPEVLDDWLKGVTTFEGDDANEAVAQGLGI